MPAIVQYPSIVREAVTAWRDVFANASERVHLAEYLTGVMTARRKNASAISREFTHGPDQSCLNRWLTAVEWDEHALNRARLEWMQQDPATRYSDGGVIAIDNVLIDHDGKMIHEVGYFWDHAEQRHKIAHDYLIANYVCAPGNGGSGDKHYPLEFRRFVKRDACAQKGVAFIDHNQLFRELVDWMINSEIPGDFTFDSWFTCAENLNHIHARGRGYVGDLKFNRLVFAAHSILMRQMRRRPCAWTRERLTTIGQACRAVARETFCSTID